MAAYFRFAMIFALAVALPCLASEDSNVQKIVDGFTGLWSDLKERIIAKYKSVENFQANTKEEMSQKMNDTYEYLSAVKQHKDDLVEQAKNSTTKGFNEAAAKLDTWIADVKDAQTKWANAAEDKKEELKNQWNTKMKDDWNSGMDSVIAVSQNAKITDQKNAGNSPSHNSIFAFGIVFCVVYGFLN